MNTTNGFDKRFAEALAASPEVPDCYNEIMRRIKRENAGRLTIRAIAALLLISLISIFSLGHRAHEAVSPEVVEELQSIHNQISGDDFREELVASSLVGEDSF
jgi:hypothetical protein